MKADAYESLDNLFRTDAVQSKAAKGEGMGLWSFDDSCLIKDNHLCVRALPWDGFV